MLGLGLGLTFRGGSVLLDLATLASTLWVRGSYTGSPWEGVDSDGTSGSHDLTEGTDPPTTGTALNGHVPASFNGNQQMGYATLGDLVSASPGWSSWVMFRARSAATGAGVPSSRYLNPSLWCGDSSVIHVGFSDYGVHVGQGNISGTQCTPDAIPCSIEEWHVAFTWWDEPNGLIWLQLDDGTPVSAACTSIYGLSGVALRVGANYNASAFFDGEIEDLELRNVPFSGTEAADIYASLKARYPSAGWPRKVSQPYAPRLTDFASSTDEQTLSGTIKRHNSFARIRLRTSGESLRVGYWCDFSGNAMYTVVVNGAYDQTLLVTGDGSSRTVDVTLPSGTDKVVDIWEGPQFGYYEPNISAGVITSLEMLDDDLWVIPPAAPERRTVFYGDSISNGYPGVPGQSYAGLLRIGGNVGSVTVYGSGGRSIDADRIHQTLTSVAEKLSDALAEVRSGGRQDLVVVIGTNDWGFGTDGGVSNFQTSVATLIDAVHTLQPDANVHLVSPILRDGEATPNGNGDTLDDYRTAMSTVASTRGPWCVYWDASAVLTLGDLGDGVHPNVGGYATLATYFEGTVLA